MKKVFLIGSIIAFIITSASFYAKCQTSAPLIDVVNINQFDLTLTGNARSTNSVLLGESDFLQKFGTPVSTVTEYVEGDETEPSMTHYSYNGMDAWYANDELQAIVLTNSNYSFKLSDGTTVKVGDNYSTAIGRFSVSFSNMVPGEQKFFVGLEDNTGPVDEILLFEYDWVTGAITSISVQQE